MNIDKIKADAEAASHQEWDWLCESDGFDVEHSAHIANCDPATILKMVAAIDAANNQAIYGFPVTDDLAAALKALEMK